ncbi:Serine/threonine-protein kinase [Podochytrium sp. JEL0797]|nr:Serine/threonine-protein kinase [Podochytrium sp. JEL0797]
MAATPANTNATTALANGASSTAVVGGYSVREEIGRGSFATVYLGVRGSERVAIKSVNRDKLNRKLAENLESEIKILRDMHHRNIVALLDIVKTDRHIHLVMEFCSLGDLSQFIKKKGAVGSSPMPQQLPLASPWGGIHEAVIRHFLAQLAAALETLRSLSLIHRDLKPQNLLLCPPDLPSHSITVLSPYLNAPPFTIPALPILKLADFGFARALPQQSLASTLCGSPLYMAPEILRGDRYDAKVDLWSLGTILYEMLTGRPPYKAQNHIDLLRKIDKGEGWIKFPGDDESEGGHRSSRGGALVPQSVPGGIGIGGPERGMGIVSSSVGNRRLNVNQFPAASLGASPKFPVSGQPGMIGVRPISDDLKDLTRRLLKRNPIERMSFEEFFMHTAVVLGASNVDIGPPRPTSSTPTPPTLTERRDEDLVLKPPATPILKPFAIQTNPTPNPTPLVKQSKSSPRDQQPSPVNPHLPDPSSIPLPSAASKLVTPSSKSSNASIPPSAIFPTPAISSIPQPVPFSHPPQQQPPQQSDDIFGDLEPPFDGYDLDPRKLFGDLLMPSPKTTPQQPLLQKPSSSSAPQHRFTSKKLPQSTEEDGSSSISSLGSLELSEEMDEDDPKHTTTKPIPSLPAAPSGSKLPLPPTTSSTSAPQQSSRALKSSFDDFELIDTDTSKPTEVNWLEPQGISEAMQSHNQHPLLPSGGGPFTKHPSSGFALPAASPPASPFSKRMSGDSLKSSRSGAGVGSAGSSGGGGGYLHEYGTRVFGSLRDSAHNFLDTMISNSNQHGGGGGGGGGGHNASQSSNTHTGGSGGGLPGTSPSGAQWAQQQQQRSPQDETSNLLTILNLSTLRGHALHTFADECHRDLVMNAQNRMIGSQTGATVSPPDNLPPSTTTSTSKDTTLAEETLSLYLATLRMYQFGLESARSIWSLQQTRLALVTSPTSSNFSGTEPPHPHASEPLGSTTSTAATAVVVDLKSLDASVVWMKEKFDDCLERAQEVKGVIGETVEEEGVSHARAVDRMVYERSLEVCRAAAQAESSGLYQSAEIGYTHAVHLLEAVLYAPPPSTVFGGSGLMDSSTEMGIDMTMSDNDRVVVERFLMSIGKRMAELKEFV